MLENWPDDFLPLDAKLLDAFAQVHRRSWGRTILAFHQARGLPKSHAVSTDCSAGTRLFATKSLNDYFLVAAALISSPGATTGWRNGIMARSLGPSCSTGCCCSRWRVARKFGQPFSFSSIHFLAKLPSRISARIFFISSRVCLVTMRGPET